MIKHNQHELIRKARELKASILEGETVGVKWGPGGNKKVYSLEENRTATLAMIGVTMLQILEELKEINERMK